MNAGKPGEFPHILHKTDGQEIAQLFSARTTATRGSCLYSLYRSRKWQAAVNPKLSALPF